MREHHTHLSNDQLEEALKTHVQEGALRLKPFAVIMSSTLVPSGTSAVKWYAEDERDIQSAIFDALSSSCGMIKFLSEVHEHPPKDAEKGSTYTTSYLTLVVGPNTLINVMDFEDYKKRADEQARQARLAQAQAQLRGGVPHSLKQ